MKIKITVSSVLLCLILSACTEQNASAQSWKTGANALQAVRKGTALVRLKMPTPSSSIQSAGKAAELAAPHLRYAEAQRALHQARQALAAPVEIPAVTRTTITIGGPAPRKLGVITQRKIELERALQQEKEALYDWGKSAAAISVRKSPLAPSLTTENGEILINAGGRKAVITSRAAKGGETVITPNEISVNADALRAASEPFNMQTVLAFYTNSPEKAAEFYYRHENFTASLEEFSAAAEAFNLFNPPAETSFRVRMFGQSEQAKMLHQNYKTAAANLALDSANLLQFMDRNPELFSGGLESYKTIMKLNNANSNTPAVFQHFWHNNVSI